MATNTSTLIKATTGDELVLPGHPIALAFSILSVFGSYAEAMQGADRGVSAAESSGDIEGSASMVQAAVDLLNLHKQGAGADEISRYARDMWFRHMAAASTELRDAGQRQAEKLLSVFLDRLNAWSWQAAA